MKVQGRITSHKQYFAALISSYENWALSLHSTVCPLHPDTGEETGQDRVTREGRNVCSPASRG